MAALASEASMDSSNISGFPDIESDCDEAWRELAPGLEAIYLNKLSLGKSDYLKLYNTVYNYCVVKCCNYEGIESAYEQCCHALYKRLAEFVGAHVRTFIPECQKRADDCEALIEYYVQIWGEFSSSSQVIDRIFAYLNQHWIKREIEDGNRNLLHIYSLCLSYWRSDFLDRNGSGEKIIGAVVQLLEKERQGNTIDSGVRSAVQSYVDLGVSSCPTADEKLYYYRGTLEKNILKSTLEFYRTESREFLDKNSVSDYLTQVELRLREEEDRVRRNLDMSSLKKVIQHTEKALIAEHMDQLMDEFQKYLDSDIDQDNIKRMHQVVRRHLPGEIEMAQIFEKHVTREGEKEITNSESSNDAQKYIDAILKIRDKYDLDCVKSAFSGDAKFAEALDKACIEYINRNSVTRQPKCADKSPQLLAVYCHQLLKKRSRVVEESELEDQLDKAMKILLYVEAKDSFEKYYKQKLCYRLIDNLSASDDAEKLMHTKLQPHCGSDYISTLERMFNDVGTASKTINEEFKKHISKSGQSTAVDLYVHVLTSGYWPLSQGAKISLPRELDMCTQQFRNFYTGQQAGADRILNWVYERSRGELVTNCFETRHTLVASTYQIAILMQYNFADNFTFKQLQERTQINLNELQQIMQIFLTTKLLVCDDISSDTKKENESIPDDAVFSLFQDYKNKRVRVIINTPLRTNMKDVEEKIDQSIQKERNYLTQTMIVKIMKEQKEMQHNDLLLKVIDLLKSKFIPTAQNIKRNIDQLIGREYLSRKNLEEDCRTYLYVA